MKKSHFGLISYKIFYNRRLNIKTEMTTKRKSPAQKSPEILIVEDSLTQATQIKHLLESHHYKVSVTQNGKQAMDWLSKHKPSLVISDIVMPEMNGYELCKKIKSNKSTQDIPVVLLTRLSDSEEIIEGLSCGADSFITKPFNEKYLLSNIEKILSEENGKNQKKVPFGVQILFKGKKRFIQAEQQNVIKVMLDIYEGAVQQNERLVQTEEELRLLNERLESLVEDRTSDLTAEIKLSNQIANRLKESEEKYRRIFENVQDLYYETSIEGTILEVSPSIELMSKGQYKKDDLIGRSMYDFYSDLMERETLLNVLRERGFVSDFEITLKNRDGSQVPCSISSKICLDAQGRPEKIIGSMRDITKRKQAEKALRESEVRYKTLFFNAAEGIIVANTETMQFLYTNPALCKMFGYTEEELMRLGVKDIHPKESLDYVMAEFEAQMRGEKTLVSDLPCQRKDGTLFYADIRTTSMVLDGFKCNVGFFIDITERKHAENTMKLAKEKAEASDKLKTSFLNNISHEVRTPLNGILGFAEIMSHEDISDEDKDISRSMLFESSDRLLDTITNYMDISLITSGNMALNKKDFVPGQIMKGLSGKYKAICSARKLELLLKIPEHSDKLLINSDPEIFRKIISHLLSNAIKFTEKGSIKYGYTIRENELEFFVTDTGIGIGKESLESVFDRFVKEEYGPLKVTEGSGLGLSISKGLAEFLGGKIWVESEKGKGSTFFFTIPQSKENETHHSVLRTDSQDKNKTVKSILIAEDDETNFFYLKALLKHITSAGIIHASNGREAIDKFKEIPDIGLVLMDIKMPVMDGLEATRQIKAIKQDVPVIAVTAYAMAGDENIAFEAGCDGYLTKPINKKLLFEKIVEFIEI